MIVIVSEGLEDFIEETSEKHLGYIKDRMPRVYSDHVMTKEQENVWRCGRPGSSNWHFYVAILPHCIVVYGDIGEMIIRPGWNRGIGWLRGCLDDGKSDSFSYMLGKVPSPHRQEVFMPGDVIAECLEYGNNPDNQAAHEVQNALDDWAERIGDNEDQRESWYAAASHADLECEWYAGYNDYSSEMYWCAYALQWFVAAWVKENDPVAE